MNNFVPAALFKFICESCDINTNNKKDYNKHCLTAKHRNRTTIDEKLPIFAFMCKKCSKGYKARNSLWYHEQKCNYEINGVIESKEYKEYNEKIEHNNKLYVTDSVIATEVSNLSNIVIELIKSNTELQKQMMEVCKHSTTTINNHNGPSNSHNKTFNMQFFLNEQCKDAMNIMDFVDSMTLDFADLEDVGKLGYVEGMSGIIIRKLNEMDIYKRPIHCSDGKREIMFVKDDNVWEKENGNYDRLRKAIKHITKKNGDLMIPWSKENPSCMDIQHKMNDVYLQIMSQCMGGRESFVESENKIMKKIAKAVFIDKACQ
jgi:hypothetical protein